MEKRKWKKRARRSLKIRRSQKIRWCDYSKRAYIILRNSDIRIISWEIRTNLRRNKSLRAESWKTRREQRRNQSLKWLSWEAWA